MQWALGQLRQFHLVGIQHRPAQAVFVDKDPGPAPLRVRGCEVADSSFRIAEARGLRERSAALLVPGEEEIVALRLEMPGNRAHSAAR